MKKILIVTANYYPEIADNIKISAVNFLEKKYILYLIDSPGVFEIPVIISKYINDFDGVVALGSVIKGETPHFDFISTATTNAIMQLSIKYNKPIGNGILTCLSMQQAIARVNKGEEAASAVDQVLSNEPKQ